ncbi:MAG TPA: hypothetical protein ENK66_06220 [Arcobacter sp.]|nr:hypothetical protein [Arcobacter sp.]
MSSDWQYIEDHMGGHDEDGLPNFMSEPGFSDDYDDDEDSYDTKDENNNLEVEFNVGDIVKLNSNDVLMTIRNIDIDILECRWFDKNDNIQSEKFNVLEISLVDKVENHHNSSDNEDGIPF